MNKSEWIKPAAWGVVGGGLGAIIIGFSVGGWVTGGGAADMEQASAESAVMQAFLPICVTQAQETPEKIEALEKERRWDQDDFVVDAGWVDNVAGKYRTKVARSCATTLIEGMETSSSAG